MLRAFLIELALLRISNMIFICVAGRLLLEGVFLYLLISPC